MDRRSTLTLCTVFAVMLCIPLGVAASPIEDGFVLVGQLTDLTPNGYSGYADVSADGRYVAFYSQSDNLTDQGSAWGDVLVYDTDMQTCELVSVGLDDASADQSSGEEWAIRGLSISDDATMVAFNSWASNLVADDSSFDTLDVFVRDMRQGLTRRISEGLDGIEANDASWSPIISGDGSHVAFVSRASNLVPDDGNGSADVFLADLEKDSIHLVSTGILGGSAASDPDGRTIMGGVDVSADGRYVAFVSRSAEIVAGDTNGCADVFVRDTREERTIRVSVSSDGRQGNKDSGERLPEGGGVALSRDGRYVAFVSWASNLVPGDTNQQPDVFLHDIMTGMTERVSVATDDLQAVWSDSTPAAYQQLPGVDISGDGRYIVFQSAASNLAGSQAEPTWGVYVHDAVTGITARIADSYVGGGVAALDGVSSVAISADASTVVFGSNSAAIAPAGSLFSDVYAAHLDLTAFAPDGVQVPPQQPVLPTIVPTPTLMTAVPTAPVVLPTVSTTLESTPLVITVTPAPSEESMIPEWTPVPDLSPTPAAGIEDINDAGWLGQLWQEITSLLSRPLRWLVSLSQG